MHPRGVEMASYTGSHGHTSQARGIAAAACDLGRPTSVENLENRDVRPAAGVARKGAAPGKCMI